MATSHYDNVYYAVGELARDNGYLALIFSLAFSTNDVVDLVTMVHGSLAWPFPEGGQKKLRLVFNEGPNNDDTRADLVLFQNASAAIGFRGTESCSPLITFGFLSLYFEGNTVQEALKKAYQDAKNFLKGPGFSIATMLTGYSNRKKACMSCRTAVVKRGNALLMRINDKPVIDDDIMEVQLY